MDPREIKRTMSDLSTIFFAAETVRTSSTASREQVQAARLVQFSISKYCKTRSEKYADLARLRFETLTAMALREIEPLSPADPALDKSLSPDQPVR